MGKRGGIRRYPIQQGKIDKYRNTVSKIIEIPIPHVQLVTHTLYPSRVFFFISSMCASAINSIVQQSISPVTGSPTVHCYRYTIKH